MNGPFVFLGRLQHDKGPVVFAQAARQAGVPATFVGAGDAAELVRRAYPEAELTGWVDPAGVREMIRAARAVVNPSLIYETQGLTALEAAAHGVPSVVSDVSVGREAVRDGETGLWFRGGDAEDLAEKLIRLHSNPDLVKRLGSAAYRGYWSQPRDMRSHLDELEQIYRLALAR